MTSEKMQKSLHGKRPYTVLVAVDDSPAMPLIVDFVVNHKWPEGALIKVINAVTSFSADHPMATYPLFLESVEKDVREYAEKLVETAKSGIQRAIPEYEITTEVVAGQPADVILDMAKLLDANLIVLGSHGRRGITRFMLGSVSGAVASHAPCNVMIVRMPKGTETNESNESNKSNESEKQKQQLAKSRY